MLLSQMRGPTMKKARVAQGVGLLSLPDEILADIACESLCWRSKEYYSDWVSAAMTCKRLRDVQLPNFITVHNWKSKASLEATAPSAARTQYMCRVYCSNLTHMELTGCECNRLALLATVWCPHS